MPDLIRDYQPENDPTFKNTLQMPKVVAPVLKDSALQPPPETAPIVFPNQLQVPKAYVPTLKDDVSNQPEPAPIQLPNQLTQEQVEREPVQDIPIRNENLDQQLNTQYPTLTYGSSVNDDRRTSSYDDWLNSVIQQKEQQVSTPQTSSTSLPAPGETTKSLLIREAELMETWLAVILLALFYLLSRFSLEKRN
jgi:hypothetical protein